MMNPVKAKANYSRVCQLLVNKGGDALRGVLHAKHPPSILAAELNANKKKLLKIRYNVIKPSQWDLLFPVSGKPDSNNFDITLLTILLRNICGLIKPATGWDDMPPPSDTSESANIARIKIFRNDVYGHIASAQLDDTTFENFWQKISLPLIKLGIPQQEIDELKEAPLSPEEESYIDKLKEWKELEDDILSKLNDVKRAITKLRKTVEHENSPQVEQLAKFDFTGKIDGLCTKFDDDTRQWFIDKLSSWFCEQKSRVMILTAGPGTGKSVLSAKICELYKQRSQLAAYHFCDFRNSDSRNPHRILQSLASQMCDNVDGFCDKLTEVLRRQHSRDLLSDAFRVLLNDPLHALDRREPLLIVVDALDESKTDIRSEFLELIAETFPELPDWIKIFITSRPELQVRKKLQHLNPVEILPDDPHHNLDLKHFIGRCLPDLSKVSDFQMSPEARYALKNGGNLLLNVADTDDFHWLVNVRVNYLKLKFCDSLNADFFRILGICRSKLSDPIFWAIIQLHAILRNFPPSYMYAPEHKKCYIYLQSLVNGHFVVLQMNNNYETEARNILDKTNELWVEEVRNERNFKFKIISHAVYDIPNLNLQIKLTALSPDNKLLACGKYKHLEVFNLPTLTIIFQLNVSERNSLFEFPIFSPDSSYLLLNSVRTCISIVDQKEIPFIPHGPQRFRCCSFSSCGTRLVTLQPDFIKVWDVIKKNLLVEVENMIEADYCCFSKCNSHILATNWSSSSFDNFALFDSRTLASLKAGDICADTCLTYEDNYQIISPCHNENFSTSITIDHYHFPSGETLLVANRYCSKPFNWKNKKCVIFSKCPRTASRLVVYDFMNKEIVDEFHINCFPNHSQIVYISNLDETHFLICLSYGHIFLLSFETSAEFPRASFVNHADVKCCALSPDNSYIACCYKNSVLAVRSVDNGETAQTVKLKQRPKACWWSELYLWVVYKGVVVKYPYDSTQRKVLGNELEECTINFDQVLKFSKDVLVIRDGQKISIFKFCKEKLCHQHVSDLISLNSNYLHDISLYSGASATISSDGCAVLLYDEHNSNYQVWEIACENRWELHSAGRFDGSRVRLLFLTGTKNSQSSLRLYLSEQKDIDIYLSSVDLSNSTHHTTHKLPYSLFWSRAPIYGDPKHLIFKHDDRIHFVKVPDSVIAASLYLGKLAGLEWNVSTFYIASRSLLLLVGETDINFLKIHNIKNYLL